MRRTLTPEFYDLQAPVLQGSLSFSAILVKETDDIPDFLHRGLGSGPCPLPTLAQNCIDMAGIGRQAAHFAGDRRKDMDRKVDESRLEDRKLLTTEFAQNV